MKIKIMTYQSLETLKRNLSSDMRVRKILWVTLR